MKKKNKTFFGLIKITASTAIIIFLLFSGIKIIPTTDNGIVTRFGKYNKVLMPGLNFVLPFVDKVHKVTVTKVQKEEFGFRTANSVSRSEWQNSILHESSMLTGDLNIINVEWVVQYRITDPKAWLFNVEESERTKTIRDISKSVVNSLVGDRAIMDIIGSDRDSISILARDKMNEKYKQIGLGISVSSVQLQNVVPPAEVQSAFEDVNIAIQDMNRLINEGKEAYNKEIPRVQGEAQRLIEEARGYASERINKASGDVARFNSVYAEYIKAPEITRRRLYLETLESVFSNRENLIIVDKNLKNFLPLKELKNNAK